MDFTLDELKNLYSNVLKTFKRWQFTNKKQLAFLEDLAVLINDGIPANRAVDMMTNVTTGLTREVAVTLSQKIAQGQPLAEGMRDWFSLHVVEIIRVGESGGALAQTLRSAINMLSQRGLALSSFASAISYPLFVIVIACVVIVYLRNAVMTQFELIKPIDQWPPAGQRLISAANMISSWWWLVILLLIATFLIFRYLMTNYVGEFRSVLDRFPPFSFYRRLTAARFLETLGLLVSNGVVFKSALRVMQHQANPYLQMHLDRVEHLLSIGRGNIADVLDTGLVNSKDLMRLRVMAEVKGFEHGLVRMGVKGAEESLATLKFIARIIGGVLLLLGGVMIIIIIQGIYMTGMSMT